jgi:serine protease Do
MRNREGSFAVFADGGLALKRKLNMKILKPFDHSLQSVAMTAFAEVSLLLALAAGSLVSSVCAAPPPKLNIDEASVLREGAPGISFAPVVKKVSSSVVNIYTTKTVRADPRLYRLFEDPVFRKFFGDTYGLDQVPRERREQSLGSGVIVSQDGYILTNNHVVQGADEVKVALADEKTVLDAKIVGTDSHTDVAVIKVDGQNLAAITLTNSDQLEVGDVVLAIGDPFGVGQTVTMGIVSAKDRGMGMVDYEDFIQTDASINPGNSGGALVDANGRLAGINTAILSRSGGNQGIGFAIPVNLARSVMEHIIVEGKVKRGYLGVKILALTPALAGQLNLPGQTGALVGDVTANSPGERAGLKKGDIVIAFDGKDVTDGRHLRLMVAEKAPGSKVSIKILRDGKEQMLTAELGELPSTETALQPGVPDDK